MLFDIGAVYNEEKKDPSDNLKKGTKKSKNTEKSRSGQLVRSGADNKALQRAGALVSALERIARACPKGRMDYVEERIHASGQGVSDSDTPSEKSVKNVDSALSKLDSFSRPTACLNSDTPQKPVKYADFSPEK